MCGIIEFERYSYSPTKFADENPQQLGKNHLERALKDYNGQTYWLTLNLKSLLNIENSFMPNWLSFALGYSGDSMTQPYPQNNNLVSRQYFLSLDVDLNKIKTKSPLLNSIFLNFKLRLF